MIREIIHWEHPETKDKLAKLNWDTVCFDTETTHLWQDRLEITGISLCDGEYNYYLPIEYINRYVIMQYLMMLFKGTTHLICHNIVFDLRVLHKYNICFNNKTKLFDTMVASHLINENDKKGLKHLTRTILERDVADYDEKLSHYSEKFYQYGLDDSYNTWLLYEHFLPKLFDEKLDKLFFKIEMPFQWVLLEMALEGVTVDLSLLRKQQDLLQDEILNLKKGLYDALNERYMLQLPLDPSCKPTLIGKINFNSSQQLIEIFNKLDIPIRETTPSGAPSVGKATLKQNSKHPFIKQLQRYKDVVKLYDGFICDDGQVVQNLQKDGKVRPSFIDTGTATGRMSCSEPNLQQLPNNREDMNIKPREVFKAPEGYKMFSCDYSSQEVMAMAHISRDEELIKMLRMNQDQHLVNANAVFNLGLSDEQLIKGTLEYAEVEKKYHDYRKKGKVFSFGVPYGMGAHKFSNDFGVSKEEAQVMIDNLAEKFPRLFERIKETHELVNKEFQVRSLAGRIRHFGEGFSLVKLKNKDLSKYKEDIIKLMKQGAAHRQSFNFLIQSLCADMVRAAMVNVYKRKMKHPEWGLTTVMQVHDESVYIVKEEYVSEATALVKESFEDVTKKFILPLTAEIEIGENYGNSKK